MKLNDLTSNYETRIARVNRWLEETYGFKVYDKVSLEELYKVKADLDTQRENLKLSLPFNSYHQNPEYAKNILLSEAVVLMIGQIDNAELVEATLTIDVDPGTATRAEKVCADNNVTCGMENGKFVMKGEEQDILRVCYKMKWPGNIYQGKIKESKSQGSAWYIEQDAKEMAEKDGKDWASMPYGYKEDYRKKAKAKRMGESVTEGRLGFKDLEEFGKEMASKIDTEARKRGSADMEPGEADELRFKIAKEFGLIEDKKEKEQTVEQHEVDEILYLAGVK